ncbi:MAG: hypothetical protein A2756_04430 [Candidatus Ryanbacteria bacterium RIFCSPHIGHO2_01_FULL_48_27]|uniref:Uncharacterized protein n=1 Tax=Candidatus Ryanbacteria bacterium RIFCSPHIGHO2_01_FULL_48_27 TaxID=1802115 RepID=A0A1G2G7X0_9BACT|nr:MAG: hypothetical protein A2756_04430 [Candidatus Ryanbacteria bacterium RIFCSPHIGHO2_01_FULL_48_27]
MLKRSIFIFLGTSLLGVVFFRLLLPANAAHTPTCHAFTQRTVLPERFGLPYDVFLDSRPMTMQATCTDSVATMTFGVGSSTQYIYHQGWRYDAGEWVPITLTSRERKIRGAWFPRSAQVTLALGPEGLARNDNYVLAYICTNRGKPGAPDWRCGCNDKLCADAHWNLQKIQHINPTGAKVPPKEYMVTTVKSTAFAGTAEDCSLLAGHCPSNWSEESSWTYKESYASGKELCAKETLCSQDQTSTQDRFVVNTAHRAGKDLAPDCSNLESSCPNGWSAADSWAYEEPSTVTDERRCARQTLCTKKEPTTKEYVRTLIKQSSVLLASTTCVYPKPECPFGWKLDTQMPFADELGVATKHCAMAAICAKSDTLNVAYIMATAKSLVVAEALRCDGVSSRCPEGWSSVESRVFEERIGSTNRKQCTRETLCRKTQPAP